MCLQTILRPAKLSWPPSTTSIEHWWDMIPLLVSPTSHGVILFLCFVLSKRNHKPPGIFAQRLENREVGTIQFSLRPLASSPWQTKQGPTTSTRDDKIHLSTLNSSSESLELHLHPASICYVVMSSWSSRRAVTTRHLLFRRAKKFFTKFKIRLISFLIVSLKYCFELCKFSFPFKQKSSSLRRSNRKSQEVGIMYKKSITLIVYLRNLNRRNTNTWEEA